MAAAGCPAAWNFSAEPELLTLAIFLDSSIIPAVLPKRHG